MTVHDMMPDPRVTTVSLSIKPSSVRQARLTELVAQAPPIDHPNVLPLRDIVMERGHCLVVSDHARGRTLTDVLQGERLPLDRVRHLLIQVAQALVAAHSQHVFHGALSPDDVIVSAIDHVVVRHFGVHGVLQSAGVEVLPGSSVMYAAPEATESRAITPQVDLFALGAIAFQMSAGLNLESDVPVRAMFRHLIDNMIPPSEVDSVVSDDWDRLILSMINPDLDHRCQTAEAALYLLQRVDQPEDLAQLSRWSDRPVRPAAPQPRQPAKEFVSGGWGREIEDSTPVDDVPVDVARSGTSRVTAMIAAAVAILALGGAAIVLAIQTGHLHLPI